jgi:PilZ domain
VLCQSRAPGGILNGEQRQTERRKWPRLPLAIPVFVHSRDDDGKESLEFATALNVSAGGMLLAIRRALPALSKLRLEIPSAPVADVMSFPQVARSLQAKTLRTIPMQGGFLLGLKFSRALLTEKKTVRSRKVLSPV